MKRTLGIAIFLVLWAVSAPVLQALAESVPALPHAFHGALTIDGAPAPAGTVVEARGTGVVTGIAGNPLTTSAPGTYGGPGALAPKLIAQGDIADGTVLSFFVNGVAAGQTAQWRSGQVTQLDLSVIIASSPASSRNKWMLIGGLAAGGLVAAGLIVARLMKRSR